MWGGWLSIVHGLHLCTQKWFNSNNLKWQVLYGFSLAINRIKSEVRDILTERLELRIIKKKNEMVLKLIKSWEKKSKEKYSSNGNKGNALFITRTNGMSRWNKNGNGQWTVLQHLLIEDRNAPEIRKRPQQFWHARKKSSKRKRKLEIY